MRQSKQLSLFLRASICVMFAFAGLAVAEQPANLIEPAKPFVKPAVRKPLLTLPNVSSALPQRFDGYGWMIRLHPTPAATYQDACEQAKKKGIAMPGGYPVVFDLSVDGQPQFYGASISGNSLSLPQNAAQPSDQPLAPLSATAVIAIPARGERPAKPDWLLQPAFQPGVLLIADAAMPSAALEKIVADWTLWLGDDRIDLAAQTPKGRAVLPCRPADVSTNLTVGDLCVVLEKRLAETAGARPAVDAKALNAEIKTFYANQLKYKRLERVETNNLQSLLNADPVGYHGSGRSFWQNHMAFFYAENAIEPRLSRAFCLANAAVFHEPTEPDYLDTLAETYYASGQYGKAIEVIDSALKQITDHGRPMGGDKRRYLEGQRKKFAKADKASRMNAVKMD